MSFPELLPPANFEQRLSVPPAEASTQPVPWCPTGPGALLRFQLKRLVGEILADRDLNPDICVSLLGRLAANPGHPEQALLAHLGDVQDPEDLPPYKVRKKL